MKKQLNFIQKLISPAVFFALSTFITSNILVVNANASNDTTTINKNLEIVLPEKRKPLRSAWFLFDPYSMIIKGNGFETLTGLDVELLRAIADNAGYNLETKNIDWGVQFQRLKLGEQDIATTASYSDERAKFVYFSEPYRNEENSFYVRKGDAVKYSFNEKDMKAFIKIVKDKKIRIATMEGAVWADPIINQYLADPAYQNKVVKTKNFYENIELLLKGEVDGVIDDRLVASTSIWRVKASNKIEEVHLGISTPIHLVFSKTSVPLAVVERFNKAIEQLKESGDYSRILKEYLFPVILLQTVERPWFFFLELLGVCAALVAGLILAHKDRLNLYGTAVLSFVAMSGGIIRDILVNRPKLGIMTSPFYATLILTVVVFTYVSKKIIAYFFARQLKEFADHRKKKLEDLSNMAIDFFDALTLGAFTITGVIIAVVSKLEPLWLWGPFLAVITTTGGTLAREILRGNSDIKIMKTEFYAPIAFIWGGVLSLVMFLENEVMSPEKMFNWIMIILVGSFLTRLVFIYHHYRSMQNNIAT